VLREREPVYQGRRLSQWLESCDPYRDSPQFDEAVRAMGTNVIPTLLGMLETKYSPLKQRLYALGLYSRLGLHFTPTDIKHTLAVKGFRALGAAASNAVPALIELAEPTVFASPSHSGADFALNALFVIGPSPPLIRSTTSTNPNVRVIALFAMSHMGAESQRVVPVLIKSLRDPDRKARDTAFLSLAILANEGGDAKAAVHPLLEALKDRSWHIRFTAAQTLGYIHSEPELVVPALMELLHDPVMDVHEAAADALGAFGADGRPAVTQLLGMLSESNARVKVAASRALRAIDPEAAAKAGIQ
jgi:HEAT repeat protein